MNFIKGILIAFATLVPGVSGGTMMIILNVYNQTIEAMSQLISGKLVHKKLILQLVLGGLFGLIFLSSTIEWIITRYPTHTSFLFLGIIVAGIGAFIKNIEWSKVRPFSLTYLFGGLFFALLTTFLKVSTSFEAEFGLQYILLILLSGIVIAVALILPGISTSFLLLSLGMYDDTLRAFSTFDLGYIVPLGIGVIFGLLLTTKLLEWMLKNHPTPTYLMILGFVLGSVIGVFPGWPAGIEWVSMSLMFVTGMVLMFLLQWAVNRYPSPSE